MKISIDELQKIILEELSSELNELDMGNPFDFFRVGGPSKPAPQVKRNYKALICKQLSGGFENSAEFEKELNMFPKEEHEKISDLIIKLSDDQEATKRFCTGGQQQAQQQTQQQPEQPQQPSRTKETPSIYNVEKGKNSLQQQLLQKYGTQLGPEANKFIAAIARDIKADLASSGIKVQESLEDISSNILFELMSDGTDIEFLFEAATQADVVAMRAEIEKLKAAMKTSTPEGRKFQERELEKLKAKKNEMETELATSADKEKAAKAAAAKKASLMQRKVSRDDAAQKMQNMQQGRNADKQKADLMKKTLQTKRVSRPGMIDINQAVYSKLAALKKLNPQLAKKLDTLTPQIMKAVMKYVNYAISSSGKQGEIKVLAKPVANPAIKENKDFSRINQLAGISKE